MLAIIHCSKSRYGNASLITKWHLQRGWHTIGYHYVILNGQLSKDCYNIHWDGHVETGRPLDDDNYIEPFEIGAHTKGYNRSVGICLIGDGKYTSRQRSSLYFLKNLLVPQFKIVDFKQHSDFDSEKSYCAGIDDELMESLNGGIIV